MRIREITDKKTAYNEFAYEKTKDDCKLQDRFQKNGQFSVAQMQNCRYKDGI